MNFKDLINNKDVLKSLSESNFLKPTEIQEKVMPLINEGSDVLGQSKTGTGKTLAFSGPILNEIEENKKTQALILAPTRELAMQIGSDIKIYSKYMNISITTVYGSSNIMNQIKDLDKGSEIVIGTPGRVKDLIKRGKLVLNNIKTFVLDEADEMLSMGFEEDILSIFEAVKHEKQVLLFSATMPNNILKIAKTYMKKDYKTIKVVSEDKIPDSITQEYFLTNTDQRDETLARILDYYDFSRVMIFTRTKKNADDLFAKLIKKGYSCNIIHGDIAQEQRIKTLDNFKKNMFKILIATDVAARGIHVDDIELVVNYNLPESHEAYVHRIGRTGRANKKGMSITLVTRPEEKIIFDLERFTKSNMTLKEVPTKEMILENRIKEINLDSLKEAKNSKINLEKYTKEELCNIINNLVYERLNSSIGSDFSKDLTLVNKKRKTTRKESGTTRVFLTIGKLDKIEKRDFLNFIERKAGLKEGTCSNVEILSKFTFMNIKEDSFDKFYKSCNNMTYNNRVVKIEKAKN